MMRNTRKIRKNPRGTSVCSVTMGKMDKRSMIASRLRRRETRFSAMNARKMYSEAKTTNTIHSNAIIHQGRKPSSSMYVVTMYMMQARSDKHVTAASTMNPPREYWNQKRALRRINDHEPGALTWPDVASWMRCWIASSSISIFFCVRERKLSLTGVTYPMMRMFVSVAAYSCPARHHEDVTPRSILYKGDSPVGMSGVHSPQSQRVQSS